MYSQEKADAVCALLAEGQSLRKASAAVGVAASSVLAWAESNPEFSEQYAHARMRGYQLLADEIIDISDDSSADIIETEHGPKVDAERVARSKLRVDSRKWMLAKMLPKVYGDKLDVAHSGELKFTRIEREIVRPKPKNQDG